MFDSISVYMSTWVLECSLSSLGGLHKDESWSGCVSMYERLGGWWLLLLPRQPLSERQPLPRKCTLCHDPLRTGRFFIHCLGMFYFYLQLSVTWMWVRQHLWSMFFRPCFSPYSSQSFTCLVLNSLYVWKSMSSLFWSLDQFYSNVYVASPYLIECFLHASVCLFLYGRLPWQRDVLRSWERLHN